MPQTAQPLQIMTSPGLPIARYAGQQPLMRELTLRDAGMLRRVAITPPNTATLQPIIGLSGRTMIQPTNGMSYMYVTPLPDYKSMGFGHPTMLVDRTRIPLRPPPDAQTPRNMPSSPYFVSYSAPSINQVKQFMGGYTNG